MPYAGELLDRDPPTCALTNTDTVADVRAVLDDARHGFCLVLNDSASCWAAYAAAPSTRR